MGLDDLILSDSCKPVLGEPAQPLPSPGGSAPACLTPPRLPSVPPQGRPAHLLSSGAQPPGSRHPASSPRVSVSRDTCPVVTCVSPRSSCVTSSSSAREARTSGSAVRGSWGHAGPTLPSLQAAPAARAAAQCLPPLQAPRTSSPPQPPAGRMPAWAGCSGGVARPRRVGVQARTPVELLRVRPGSPPVHGAPPGGGPLCWGSLGGMGSECLALLPQGTSCPCRGPGGS